MRIHPSLIFLYKCRQRGFLGVVDPISIATSLITEMKYRRQVQHHIMVWCSQRYRDPRESLLHARHINLALASAIATADANCVVVMRLPKEQRRRGVYRGGAIPQ